MGFKCGIVGLPNVGKSTLFNALTKASIEAENYPFCTIEPNVGIVPVPDQRLNQLADLVSPEKVIPAVVELVDIAGLVKGASEGEGLGNQFLSNIRETDAIVHVVRCFSDDNVIHVSGQVNAKEDAEIINLELVLADIVVLEKARKKIAKQGKSGDKLAQEKLAIFDVAIIELQKERWLSHCDWNEQQLDILNEYGLITVKPLLYIANVAETNDDSNHQLNQLREFAKLNHSKVVPICAQIEAELVDLEDDEKQEFLTDLGWEESGLDKVIRSGYKLLGLNTYFTAGKKEVRAWTITKGDSAPQAAGKIHTDFEKGFIRAEVISYDDYITTGSEAKAKEQGKLKVEGKTYIVSDGDVIHFLFNNG